MTQEIIFNHVHFGFFPALLITKHLIHVLSCTGKKVKYPTVIQGGQTAQVKRAEL